MTEQKNAPTRIWACLEGPMVGMFVSGGHTADWPKYVRADISDDMLEALYEAEEYFDNRADTDHDETGFVPNEEMKLLTVVRAAIAKAEVRS